MPTRPPKRQIEALRALAANPGGIRQAAYRSVMPALVEQGLVRESVSKSRPRVPIWLLTDEGRKAVKELGMGEPEE